METYRPGEKPKATPSSPQMDTNVYFNATGYMSQPGVEPTQTSQAAPANDQLAQADQMLNNLDAVYGAAGPAAGDFMDMSSGFEAGNAIPVSAYTGTQSLATDYVREAVAKSFLFMFVALLITTGAALTTSPATAISMLRGGGFTMLLIVEIAIVMGANWACKKNNIVLSGILFAAYSFINGVVFSILFLCYQLSSIASIFCASAIMFGIMAVFGIVSKKDLTTIGSLCSMALLGIILVSLFNMWFIKASSVDYVVSGVGVLVFVGLTAYDTQTIKKMAVEGGRDRVNSIAMLGALNLYLDFINLFLKLLRLFGKRK